MRQPLLRGGRQGQRDLALLQPLAQVAQLDLHDTCDLLQPQRLEDDHLVDAVEQLRPKGCADGLQHPPLDLLPGQSALSDVLAAQVGRHDDDRVAEVYRPPLSVGQPPVVEHLEQHIEHFGMRLLHLVEQHHTVRPPAHRLGELARLFVAHVSRWRSHEPADGVLLLILRHVDPDHRVRVVKEELRHRTRRLRLTHPGRTQEEEAAERTVGIVQPGARRPYGVGHRHQRLILPHHALAQAVLHVDQLFHLALQQPRDRNARPLADHFSDVLGVHLLLDQLVPVARGLALLLDRLLHLLLQLFDLIAQLSGLFPVVAHLRLLQRRALGI